MSQARSRARARGVRKDSKNQLNPLYLEVLYSQLQNLREAVARLFQTSRPLAYGPLRDSLIDQANNIDAIAEVMRQAVDLLDDSGKEATPPL